MNPKQETKDQENYEHHRKLEKQLFPTFTLQLELKNAQLFGISISRKEGIKNNLKLID